jgi:hypothetical protein
MTDFLIMPGANATKQLNQRASIDFKLSSNGMKASKSGSISSSSSSTSSSSSSGEDNEYHNSVKHESVTVINDEEEEEYDDDDDEEEDNINNNNNEDINEIGSPVSSSKSFSTCSSSNAKNLSSSLNNRRKQIKPIR